jgi:hypothetical protein
MRKNKDRMNAGPKNKNNPFILLFEIVACIILICMIEVF